MLPGVQNIIKNNNELQIYVLKCQQLPRLKIIVQILSAPISELCQNCYLFYILVPLITSDQGNDIQSVPFTDLLKYHTHTRDNGERPPFSTHQQIPLTLHSPGSSYKIQLRSHCILLKFVTKDNKKIKLNKCYGEFYGVVVR